MSGSGVEADGLGQVRLGDQGAVRGMEDRRILQGLVLPLGYREEYEPEVLAEIEGRRADEITDVLDEQDVDLRDVPAVQGGKDHVGLEVANRPSDDLLDGDLAACEPSG